MKCSLTECQDLCFSAKYKYKFESKNSFAEGEENNDT